MTGLVWRKIEITIRNAFSRLLKYPAVRFKFPFIVAAVLQ